MSQMGADDGKEMRSHMPLSRRLWPCMASLALDFSKPFIRKHEHPVRADFICFQAILIALRALKRVSGIEDAQVINHLKALGLDPGSAVQFWRAASQIPTPRSLICDICGSIVAGFPRLHHMGDLIILVFSYITDTVGLERDEQKWIPVFRT